MTNLIAGVAGLLFGFGLLWSGMTNPAKVLGFLDIAGRWDPSLALVMVGAIAAAALPFRIASRRRLAFDGGAIRLPASGSVDTRLVFGGVLFGVGWGLAGFCPGPAIVAFAAGQIKAAAFVLAMLCGMFIYRRSS